jgi:hypothetical protein
MWRRTVIATMISWIRRGGTFLWQVLEAASDGGSDSMIFDYYNARLSRLDPLAPGELDARISRLEAAVLSNDASTLSTHQVG